MKKVTLILFYILLPHLAFSEPDAKPITNPNSKPVLIRDNLYADKKGNVFFRSGTIQADKKKDDPTIYVYREFFGRHRSPDDETERIKLRDVVNPKAWRRVSWYFYVDKNHVYKGTGCACGIHLYKMDDFTAKNFKMYIGDGWKRLKDIPDWDREDGIYRDYVSNGKSIYFGKNKLKYVEADSFRIIKGAEDPRKIYSTDGERIYCKDKITTLEEYKKLAEAMTMANGKKWSEYGHAMSDLIKDIKTLTESEKRGVTLKGKNLYTDKRGNVFFVTQARKGYENEKGVISGASFFTKKDNTFIYVYRDYFGKTGNGEVDQKLKTVIDPETWRMISRHLYMDENNVYSAESKGSTSGTHLHIMDGFTPKNLMMYIGDGWKPFKDIQDEDSKYGYKTNYISNGKSVYRTYKMLKGVKPDSFRVIKEVKGWRRSYATDGKNIYYQNKKISLVEYQTNVERYVKNNNKNCKEFVKAMHELIKDIEK